MGRKMRFGKAIIILLVILIFLYPSYSVSSEHSQFEIKIDPRIELLAVIQSLTSWPEMGLFTTLNFTYYEDVKSYFAPYKNHAAVKWFNDNLMRGWIYNAPPMAMLFLSSPPEMKTIIPFSDYLLKRGGGEENLNKMVDLMNRFAKDSRFMRFWNEHQHFYKEFIEKIERLIPFDEYAQLMMDFYGEEKAHFVFIPVPLFHSGGYGVQIEYEGGKIPYFFGGPHKLEDGFPVYDAAELRILVFHEFGHSFVNPVVYEHASQLNRYEDFYQYMKKEMSRQGYGSWLSVCHEHLVRTGDSFLLERAGFPEERKKNFQADLDSGFVLLPFLREKMELYVNNRDKYPSFRSFFPEIIKVFQEIKPVLSEKRGIMGFTHSFIGDQCTIVTVIENTPFHKADIRKEDILLYINGTRVTEEGFREAINIWKKAHKGDSVRFVIQRDDEVKELKIEVPFVEYYKFVKN